MNYDESNLYEDTSFYNETPELFQMYVQNTNEHEVLLTVLVEKLAKNFQHSRLLKILDIGAGPGNLTCKLLQSLNDMFAVELTYLEPVPAYAENFRSLIEDTPLTKCVKEIALSKWEEYETSEKFDFIIAIHSLYGISDLKVAINKMFTFLTLGGMAVIVVQSQNCIFYELRKRFFIKVTGITSNPLESEMVKEEIKVLGIPFEENTLRATLNLEKIINLDEEGKQLLSLLMYKKYDNVPEELRQEIIHFLREKSQINASIGMSLITLKR